MNELTQMFSDLNTKEKELTRLSECLLTTGFDVKNLKEDIKECDDLHDALTTTGVVFGDKIYTKEFCDESNKYVLVIEDYIEPVNAYLLEIPKVKEVA